MTAVPSSLSKPALRTRTIPLPGQAGFCTSRTVMVMSVPTSKRESNVNVMVLVVLSTLTTVRVAPAR